MANKRIEQAQDEQDNINQDLARIDHGQPPISGKSREELEAEYRARNEVIAEELAKEGE